MDKLLELLNQNAHLTNEQLAVMLDTTEADITNRIQKYEQSGVIRGYKAVIDWEKVNADLVVALIEVKVTPKASLGFDEIGQRLMQFHEVDTVYLMSGGFDFTVLVTGKTFKDIALFVARRLAPIDGVISTATHFVLSKYKEGGILLCDSSSDERSSAWI
ncbi:MAG TPA: Lrp/AsnC family transcriptional regulator [Firmicutes bacterium]|nr:Lrp/AsnC family transcriptional regulator [Bacillota bacterium]